MTDNIGNTLFQKLSLTNKVSIPIRNYINYEGLTFEDGEKIAYASGILSRYWVIGLSCTLSLGIFGYRLFGSKEKNKDGVEERKVIAPLWIIILPLIIGFIVAYNEPRYKLEAWKNENSSIKTMGIQKNDYLNFKSQDDRQLKSSVISLLGTFVIASSGLLNPFFRGL